MSEINDAIEGLKRAKATKLLEIQALDRALEQLQGAQILVLTPEAAARARDYEGLGIIEAAKRWLQEVGEPRGTREIADALLQRGVVTRSRNFPATVYSTLTNSREFKREGNTWVLQELKKGR